MQRPTAVRFASNAVRIQFVGGVHYAQKPKWNLSTIYISERLQESLRPISRCAMTTVVTPMGYGKPQR